MILRDLKQGMPNGRSQDKKTEKPEEKTDLFKAQEPLPEEKKVPKWKPKPRFNDKLEKADERAPIEKRPDKRFDENKNEPTPETYIDSTPPIDIA